jgi:hypothetical protein
MQEAGGERLLLDALIGVFENRNLPATIADVGGSTPSLATIVSIA